MTRRLPQYPLLRLVDEPSPSAATRFDFNDGVVWAAANVNLGAPPVLGDPGVPNPQYGYREPSFRVNTTGREGEVLARHQELARALVRDGNYLLYRHSAAADPVWLQLVRSSPAALSMERLFRNKVENTWTLDLQHRAEPFGLGEQRQFDVTVVNDPGATNGLAVQLPEIAGDAPTPLIVEIPGIDTDAKAYSLLSVTPLDGAWPGVEYAQAESGVMHTDAAVEAGTGSGNSRVSVTFALTEDMVDRVTVPVTVALAGRYRVFARFVAGCTATVRGDGSFIDRPEVTLESGDSYLADLGMAAFPFGNTPTTKPYTLAANQVTIQARRDAGVGTLKIDYLLFVPVDLPLDQVAPGTLLEWRPDGLGAPLTLFKRVIDSERYRTNVLLDGELWQPGTRSYLTQPDGAFPVAVPGATNVLHFLLREKATIGGLNWVDSVVAETDLTIKYRPRHLWLGRS